MSRVRLRACIGLVCLFLIFAFPSVAAEKWIKVKSPHFTVITNGSESEGRNTAIGFEQIHKVFELVIPGLRTDSGASTIVVAMKDRETFDQLIPFEKKRDEDIAGLFEKGWEKDYVVVRLDHPDETRTTVYHEYIHKLLRLNFTRMPVWLDEGLAEFYAYTRFRDKQVFIGAPSGRVTWLRNHTLIPLQTMLAVNPRSPYYTDPLQAQTFYAESWALTHFLFFGEGMGNGRRMNDYIRLLQERSDGQQAFEQAFGKLTDIDRLFQHYTQLFSFNAMVSNWSLNIDASSLAAASMSDAEADAMLGDFELRNAPSETAERYLTKAVSADPKLGLAHEDLAFLDFHRGDDEAAEKEFDLAASLTPDSYLAVYYQSMLRYQGKSDADSLSNLDAAMNRVLQLNPLFAPALIERSQILIKEGKLQEGFNAAQKAQALEPDRAGYLTHAAAILLLGHNYPEAAKMARSVVSRWTTTDGAEALAVAHAAERLGKIEPSAEQIGKETDEMKYAADTTPIEGIVKSTVCQSGKPMELLLQTGDKELSFVAAAAHGVGFSDTVWYGEDHFNSCHHLEGFKAVVRYKSSSDQGGKPQIIWLEIRDNLIPNSYPAPISQP